MMIEEVEQQRMCLRKHLRLRHGLVHGPPLTILTHTVLPRGVPQKVHALTGSLNFHV